MNACVSIMVMFSVVGASTMAHDPEYVAAIQAWRATREKNLRADHGWLTLAGRFPLKAGDNTLGTGSGNDVVLPAELKGTGPERLGTIHVDAKAGKVMLQLAEGVSMTRQGKPFTGSSELGTEAGKRDWVSLGRMSMHIISREGRYFLRLADNEPLVRKNFAGCVWYPVDEKFKVEATFVPYPPEKKLAIVNILEEVTQQPSPGYVTFTLNGVTYQLDAIPEGNGLLIVFRDGTSKETTYPPARFIHIEAMPKANSTFTLDFNKAYNPPCAFSEFTTCPVAPPQNVLKVRIEAGEKYRKGE